jgi:hypothetical protein
MSAYPCLHPKTTEKMRHKNRRGLGQYYLLDKIESLLLHKSDSLLKTAFVVQTAKTDVEQIRARTQELKAESFCLFKFLKCIVVIDCWGSGLGDVSARKGSLGVSLLW